MALENHGSPWSDTDEEKLSELYPVTDATQLVEEFGRTHEAIKAKAKELEISKSDDWKGNNEAVHGDAIERGKKAERRFNEIIEDRDWECFKNHVFRHCEGIKEVDESDENRLVNVSESIEEVPDWFVDLRIEVTEALESRESRSEFFPDYIVGGRQDDPLFVEVKYGSSNLMKSQIEFFDFLQENDFRVYIFRVKPHGEVDFSEWTGGWK